MPNKCPYCGDEDIISDMFEDEWVYWCNWCGREILPKEDDDEGCKNEREDGLPRTERNSGVNKISSDGRN